MSAYYLGSAESSTADFLQVWLKSSCSGDVASPSCSPQVTWRLRPPARPFFIRCRDFNVRLVSIVYYVAQQFYNSAQLWCLYFEHPPLFWKSAYILDIRQYFEQSPIFYACANILGKRQYFDNFCNNFAWFCCCKYLGIFLVFIYAFLCAPIFLAQLFWSLGLRLM